MRPQRAQLRLLHCARGLKASRSKAQQLVAIAYKTSTFDNVYIRSMGKKPLQDNDLTDSIQVNS
jgi:hypothetical protein